MIQKPLGGATGNVYTVSTVGGIFTTILVGFYVIPNFGLRATTYVIACILVVAPFLFFLKSKILISIGIIFTFGLSSSEICALGFKSFHFKKITFVFSQKSMC